MKNCSDCLFIFISASQMPCNACIDQDKFVSFESDNRVLSLQQDLSNLRDEIGKREVKIRILENENKSLKSDVEYLRNELFKLKIKGKRR